MKQLEEITKQQPVFLHNFKSELDVISEFEGVSMSESEYNAKESPWANVEFWKERKAEVAESIEKHKGEKILFASYGQEYYEGSAWVLIEKDGQLMEINGSHCSCYGLEQQWEPKPVTLDELKFRLISGTMGSDAYSDNEFANELKEFIGVTH